VDALSLNDFEYYTAQIEHMRDEAKANSRGE
jgi:hypothetical protein